MTAAADLPPDYDHEPPDLGVLDALGADFADLTRVIGTLGENVPMALDVDDTTETVVRLLADLRAQRQELARIEAFVEAAAAKRLRYGRHQVGDLIAEVRGGATRKTWEHDRLAFAVCQDITVDPATGEVQPEVADIVGKVRDRLINCAAISYWRSTQLKPLGIDVDKFCLTEPGRKTVQVTPAIDEAAS